MNVRYSAAGEDDWRRLMTGAAKRAHEIVLEKRPEEASVSLKSVRMSPALALFTGMRGRSLRTTMARLEPGERARARRPRLQ
jgi:hypothetical protein